LEWVVGRHASFTDLDVELAVEGTPRRLGDDTELAAFRIAQEALANSAKHAGAEQVAVRVRFGQRSFDLEVADDGSGFDLGEARSGFGVTGMRERARQVDGSLDLISGPDGTVVRFTAEV
ncbi:MAG: hypothetical protein R3324_19625, partial [Halobacteriales archaeon]|nr:hypothetical protein [Halobacteriales archaeon]